MSGAGDYLTCSITIGGGPVALVYRVVDSNATATATVSIDGSSNTTSFTSQGFAGQSISGSDGASETEFAQMYVGLAPGLHTFKITVSNSIANGNVVGVDFLATPYCGPPVVGTPRLIWMGVSPPHTTGNGGMQQRIRLLKFGASTVTSHYVDDNLLRFRVWGDRVHHSCK